MRTCCKILSNLHVILNSCGHLSVYKALCEQTFHLPLKAIGWGILLTGQASCQPQTAGSDHILLIIKGRWWDDSILKWPCTRWTSVFSCYWFIHSSPHSPFTANHFCLHFWHANSKVHPGGWLYQRPIQPSSAHTSLSKSPQATSCYYVPSLRGSLEEGSPQTAAGSPEQPHCGRMISSH